VKDAETQRSEKASEPYSGNETAEKEMKES